MSSARLLGIVAVFCAVVTLSLPAHAQQPILIVERERLLTASLAGKDVLAQDEEVRSRLEKEGQQLDEDFRSEELELTQLRPNIPQKNFGCSRTHLMLKS